MHIYINIYTYLIYIFYKYLYYIYLIKCKNELYLFQFLINTLLNKLLIVYNKIILLN